MELTVNDNVFDPPGWYIDQRGLERAYHLWGPGGKRTWWSAGWDSWKPGTDGSYRRGDTPEAALAVLPDDDEGTAAREALLAAARKEG